MGTFIKRYSEEPRRRIHLRKSCGVSHDGDTIVTGRLRQQKGTWSVIVRRLGGMRATRKHSDAATMKTEMYD